MDVDLILQPFEDESSLHEVLATSLSSEAYDRFDVVVAWVKGTGLERLRSQLASFRDRPGVVARLVTGLDEGGATKEGLQAGLELFDQAFLLYDSASGTFHPKVYFFRGPGEARLVIGSNNLTPGGLFFNYEAAQVTDFDVSADRALVERVTAYIDRLVSDDTSRPLTAELLEELTSEVDSVLGTEIREPEGDRERRPRGYRKLRDLFGRSVHAKKRDPRPRVRSQAQPVATGDAEAVDITGTAETVLRWSKQLTRSDCGQPRPGSHTTAALRFTKAGQGIDQRTWFRNQLFDDASWVPDPRPGRERAGVTFDVVVDGVARGTHELLLKYDAARESDQNNFTTDLKWGSLGPVLREHDAVGEWVVIDKLADGSFRLDIEPEEPSPRLIDWASTVE